MDHGGGGGGGGIGGYHVRITIDLKHGFPWGTKIGKSPISDICTEIVLFWWDFYLQGQH